MTKEQLRTDQVKIANGCNNDYNHIERLNPIPLNELVLSAISNVDIATKTITVAPYDYMGEITEAKFYYTFFDFEYIKQVKTSAFLTDQSLN